jgi:hypothetical protein
MVGCCDPSAGCRGGVLQSEFFRTWWGVAIQAQGAEVGCCDQSFVGHGGVLRSKRRVQRCEGLGPNPLELTMHTLADCATGCCQNQQCGHFMGVYVYACCISP